MRKVSIFVVGLIIVALLPLQAYAATVGTQLSNPEDGWTRYDSTNQKFSYSSGLTIFNSGNAWGGSISTLGLNTKMRFSFTGTGFRYIGFRYPDKFNNIAVYVDGQLHGTFSEVGPSLYRYFVYEVTGLENKQHYVMITPVNPTQGVNWAFDALDLQSTDTLNDPDITPPAIPAGLTAQVSDGNVTLNWIANNESDFLGYYIYRDGVKLNSNPITDTTYVDTEVTNNKTYDYQISSIDLAMNESAKSTIVKATLVPDVPTAPTGFQITLEHSGNLGFAWNPNPEINIHHYNLYMDGVILKPNITATSYIHSTATISDGQHTFYVTAVNSNGVESEPSQEITIEVVQELIVNFVPNGDSIVVQVISGRSPFTVEWSGNGVDGSAEFSSSSYTITGLEYENLYTVTVTAENGDTITKQVNTGKFKAFIPPVLPDPVSIFQRMIDSFGTSGSIAFAVITAAVALGVLIVLGIWAWRQAKRWLAQAR